MKSRSIRIGIVDDHDDIRFTLSQICLLQGWETVCAANYYEALSMMKTGPFDLFMVDYHLPEVDGVEIVREARRQYPKAIILVLTVEENEEVAKRFMAAGANDYALKPIKAVDLVTRINVHLKYKYISGANADVAKGISDSSLDMLLHIMSERNAFMAVEEIAQKTGMSNKSVYRYIQHLMKADKLELCSQLDGSIGRPKTFYRLKRQD